MRVHELAKELNLTSKELMDKLKRLNIQPKSHMSVLSDGEVSQFRASLSAKPAPSARGEAKGAAGAPKAAPAAGSIESARKEFAIQRGGLKAVQTLLESERKAKAAPPQTSAPKKVSVPPRPRVPDQAPVQAPKPQVPVKAVLREAPPAAPPPPSVAAPSAPMTAAEPRRMKKIEISATISIKDLAEKLQLRPNELIQRLIRLGIFANINQSVNFEVAAKAALEAGFEVEKPRAAEERQEAVPAPTAVESAKLKPRAPIVTFMGHVDHGKTSLLDAIRKTRVAAKEAGGITQHIGAYEVFLPNGSAVTFLDTPGHEAFTAMRARGAQVTDAVVLVVAADDGVMPQTVEAIDHAKAANVPILVAINKIDLPSANPDRVKKDLMAHDLMSEDWGGKTIMIPVSAKTGAGIDELLEMLALESELLELRANPDAPAKGVVIEAELSRESGVLATILIEDGTLRLGDAIIVGDHACKVRAMINDRGQRIQEALPSMPVEILGLPGVPKAGDRLEVFKDEKTAREVLEKRLESRKSGAGSGHISLEHLYEEIKAGKVEELKLIIKADVQGSLEAIRSMLAKIQSKNVRLNVIHVGTGDISESDVMLAAASNAVVIGFHVDFGGSAKEIAETELVDVRFYEIIYELKNAIEQAMEGLLQPEIKEVFVGLAEVRQVFKVSKVGQVAGSAVLKGKIVRNFQCRVIRNGVKIHEGKVVSLKRFKDDAREVLEGFECGIGVSNYNELTPGDRIEAYEVQKQARKLE